METHIPVLFLDLNGKWSLNVPHLIKVVDSSDPHDFDPYITFLINHVPHLGDIFIPTKYTQL